MEAKNSAQQAYWPHEDQIKALVALPIGSTFDAAKKFLTFLESSGYGAPVREDIIEGEDPLDTEDGAEYLTGFPANAAFDSELIQSLAYVGVSDHHKVTGASLTWTFARCVLADQVVSMVDKAIASIQDSLGEAYVCISQGNDWIADGSPSDAVVGAVCWANTPGRGSVKTTEEYRKACDEAEVAASMRLIVSKQGRRAADEWVIQIALIS